MELVKISYDYILTEDISKISQLKQILVDNGVKRNKYVGKPEKFFNTKDRKSAWLLGQALDAINRAEEGDAWGYIGLNHWLHMASTFMEQESK